MPGVRDEFSLGGKRQTELLEYPPVSFPRSDDDGLRPAPEGLAKFKGSRSALNRPRNFTDAVIADLVRWWQNDTRKMKSHHRKHFVLQALMFAAAGSVMAETISWESPSGGNNRQSSGDPMDAGFIFQLGVFSDGFVPTALNLSEWDDFWSVADQSSYDTGFSRFAGLFEVEDNNPPFTVGRPGWIMGTKVTVTGTERILFRRPGWLWPASSPLSPFPLDWHVNGATDLQVVIGAVNPGGSPFLMQSAVVRDYPQWRALRLAGEPLDGPLDDPDGDGVPNLLEFVFDTMPSDSASRASAGGSWIEIGGEKFLQLTIPRKRTHLATLVVQVSSDLETWNQGPDHTAVVSDTPLEWIVRDKTPASAAPGGRRFMRLKAALPE